MFASVLALALAAQQIIIPLGPRPRQIERPPAPIAESGPRYAAACKDNDDWDKPAPPVRLHANPYLVGTCGISAILVTGSDGHVLIDGGTDKGADLIAANIRALGFKLADIRFLLHSHEHHDHVGGTARLQQLTGATLVASARAATAFATGTLAGDDPQAGALPPFAPARVGRVIGDGDSVRLGNLMLTAIATPGHTAGALSWRWESCDGGVCRTMVYADSLSAVSSDKYRFTDHPALVAAFRHSLARIATSRCEILLTPHPSASAMRARIIGEQPLFDPEGCRTFAAARTKALDERLAKEAKK